MRKFCKRNSDRLFKALQVSANEEFGYDDDEPFPDWEDFEETLE